MHPTLSRVLKPSTVKTNSGSATHENLATSLDNRSSRGAHASYFSAHTLTRFCSNAALVVDGHSHGSRLYSRGYYRSPVSASRHAHRGGGVRILRPRGLHAILKAVLLVPLTAVLTTGVVIFYPSPMGPRIQVSSTGFLKTRDRKTVI